MRFWQNYRQLPPNIQKMADALLTLLQNPQSAAEMGRYAKTLSETRFSWNAIAEKVVKSYKTLLSPKDL